MIARKYRPDHLAILPDAVGACSVDQGCGVLATNKLDDDLKMWLLQKCAEQRQQMRRRPRRQAVANADNAGLGLTRLNWRTGAIEHIVSNATQHAFDDAPQTPARTNWGSKVNPTMARLLGLDTAPGNGEMGGTDLVPVVRRPSDLFNFDEQDDNEPLGLPSMNYGSDPVLDKRNKPSCGCRQ